MFQRVQDFKDLSRLHHSIFYVYSTRSVTPLILDLPQMNVWRLRGIPTFATIRISKMLRYAKTLFVKHSLGFPCIRERILVISKALRVHICERIWQTC